MTELLHFESSNIDTSKLIGRVVTFPYPPMAQQCGTIEALLWQPEGEGYRPRLVAVVRCADDRARVVGMGACTFVATANE